MLAGCVLAAAFGIGAAVTARHRAEAAADLAALAAADRMLVDPTGACAAAARVATAQQSLLTSCVLHSDARLDAVDVAVQSSVRGALFAALPPAHGRARAGPLSTPDVVPAGLAALPAADRTSARLPARLPAGRSAIRSVAGRAAAPAA
ncbi:helicase [Streptacidiphilus sp. PB12-B1b]|nr:helicase [Streptacidiphilus sp. PB12-B1b]